MEPAIKNWRNFPPPGGWSVDYTEEGQSFNFTGSPAKIVDQIRKVQQANSTYESDAAIWLYLNTIWCERAPDKCIRSMLTLRKTTKGVTVSTSGRVARRGSCGGTPCGGGRTR